MLNPGDDANGFGALLQHRTLFYVDLQRRLDGSACRLLTGETQGVRFLAHRHAGTIAQLIGRFQIQPS